MYLCIKIERTMERYAFTLRFDDAAHSLTRYNGLTVQQVGELLLDLSNALDLHKDYPLILSEVKGNCYALELTTISLTTFEHLKVLHKKVSENDFKGFTPPQKKYVSRLKTVLGDRLHLKAYDKDNQFAVFVNQIVLPSVPTYYFERTDVYGIITSIGSAALDSKINIKINAGLVIHINEPQEKQLLKYYKKNKLYFHIRNKVDVETDKIIASELIDFEVVGEKTFIERVKENRSNFPDGFFGFSGALNQIE
jgi:hypothetical protein